MQELEPQAPRTSSTAGCIGKGLAGALIVVLLVAIFAMLSVVGVIGSATDTVRSFFAPPPTPTPVPIVVSIANIRSLAELSTVNYHTVADVTDARIPTDLRRLLGGREQIVMLVYGEVKAGFDLSKIGDDAVWVDGTRVSLQLPAPQLLSTTIDFDKTRVVSYERSFFVGNDPNLQAAALERAVEAIEHGAIEAGILDLAQDYGRLFFENHLRSLGFEEVRILFH